MESSYTHSSAADEEAMKQRPHLREFRFVPEELKLASTTGRAEPRRYLKTSQAPRSRPQLLAPVKGGNAMTTRTDVCGQSTHDVIQQRLSVGLVDGQSAAAKTTPQKSARKAGGRGGGPHGRRASPVRGPPHPRFSRRAGSLDQAKGKGLQIEGNSVLSTSPAVALQALEHLGECVQEERRLKAQLEDAQQAKVGAFRSVIKVFLSACAEGSRGKSVGGADGMAVARCSVITNALAVIIQSYLRAMHSALRTRSLFLVAQLPGRLSVTRSSLSSIDHHLSSVSDRRSESESAFEQSLSTTRTLEELLDMNEINQLKQLYFDFYDCEVVSLQFEVDSEFDGDLAQRGCALGASVDSATSTDGESAV